MGAVLIALFLFGGASFVVGYFVWNEKLRLSDAADIIGNFLDMLIELVQRPFH